jgi:hypothetical protein
MTPRPIHDEHRCEMEPTQSLPWRKSPHSPVGAGTACVEAMTLEAWQDSDGSILGKRPDQPDRLAFTLVPAPSGGPGAPRSQLTLVTEAPDGNRCVDQGQSRRCRPLRR